MTTKPRVFVSSVVRNFSEEREAARRGVVAGGGEPILVNEDHPASGESSRNACLNAVETCDIVALVMGSRGGWTAPSGHLVVEEEYRHARAHHIPVLVFLQDVARAPDAERFVSSISAYTLGTLHKKWRTLGELESVVSQAVRDSVNLMNRQMNSSAAVTTRLAQRARNRHAPALRFVLVPERQEEVVTPMKLESGDFADAVQSIAHSRSVRLLRYSHPKSVNVDSDALVIEQHDPNVNWDRTEFVHLKVSEGGVIEVEVAVTHGEDGTDRASLGMVVHASDLSAVLERVFAFAAAFYETVDPHRRHQRFLYGVSLLGLGYRTIARDMRRGHGVTMSMSGHESLFAFEEVRNLTRDDFQSPENEIERIVTMLERNART